MENELCTISDDSHTALNKLNRFQVLGYEQVNRLHEVLVTEFSLHGQGNYPTFNLCLRDLINVVRKQLKDKNIQVRDMRLNGGAASYIIGKEAKCYNDLDLLFGVDLSSNSTIQMIKSAVIESLRTFLPDNRRKLTECNLQEGYVRKMIRINNCNSLDSWSLISLGSACVGQTVELKFVDKMRRKFEFTVDSFQIILDSLLTFYSVASQPMTEHFYPTVVVESVSGSFQEALEHLNKKQIATHNPEEIRGGGLLKYCKLLVEQYEWTEHHDVYRMERYMCTRFFIDFPNINTQRLKLEAYLMNHFSNEDVKIAYLRILYDVINKSTICLMNHDRRQTLHLIHVILSQIQKDKAAHKNAIQLDAFEGADWVIDQIFYGTQHFPHYLTGYYSYTSCSPLDSSLVDTVPNHFNFSFEEEFMPLQCEPVEFEPIYYEAVDYESVACEPLEFEPLDHEMSHLNSQEDSHLLYF